jgi:hypothetical protein
MAVPARFPETLFEFHSMTAIAARNLLAFYGFATDGTLVERKNRLRVVLGMPLL